MSKTILSEYLDCGLFNIGDNDSRLQVFQQAANDLGAEFLKTPSSVISAILVAVDPSVPETDPMLETAEAAIKTHWNTFTNKYQERPVGLLRPVLLDALCRAAETNEAIGCAIWLSGTNLTCRIDLGKERVIIDPLLKKLGELTEEKAQAIWRSGGRAAFKAPILDLKLPKVSGTKIDINSLETEMAAAAGPRHQDGRAVDAANPQWANSGQPWSYHFAPRAAKGIAREVDRAISPLAKAAAVMGEELQTPVNTFAKELSAAGTKWINSVVDRAVERTGLLWWKEALYSPSLRCSYRDLKPSEVVIAMAQDLHEITLCPSPQSVEYFLRETVRTVVCENPGLLLGDVLQEAHKNDRLKPVIRAAAPPEKPQRVSIQTALSYAGQAMFADNDLQAWLGVKGNLKVPADSLAVWLFRDAQSLALTSKSTGK